MARIVQTVKDALRQEPENPLDAVKELYLSGRKNKAAAKAAAAAIDKAIAAKQAKTGQ